MNSQRVWYRPVPAGWTVSGSGTDRYWPDGVSGSGTDRYWPDGVSGSGTDRYRPDGLSAGLVLTGTGRMDCQRV